MNSKSKKKIIVADDEEGIRDVFSMIIESKFDHDIFPCASAAEAIETIQKEGNIDLIFSDYDMGIDTGGDLYKYLREKNLTIPFALCSTYSPQDINGFEKFEIDHPENAYFQKPFTSDQIIEHITSVFKEEELETKEINTFVKVRSSRFMRINPIKETFNVYIRLSKKKFVKIINEGESESFEAIEKYIKKGVDYIYLEWQKYEIFEHSAIESRFEEFNKIKDSGTQEEQTIVILDTIESIQGCIKNLGVNQRTVELIDKVVDSTEQMIYKSSKLDDLLKLLQSKEGYIKDHSYLTSFLACAIADRMSWKTEGIWKKIITASLFQNIALDHEEDARVFSLDSDAFKALSDKTQDRIRNHPQNSVEILTDAKEYFSEDTQKMIRNHHERPDGSGFPRGLDSTKVAPLEALFILASNFADALMTTQEVNQVAIVAQDYNEFYNKGNYKKPYQGFLKAFIKLNLPT